MSDASYRIENRVGRLIEARVTRLRTRADVDEYGAALLLAIRARGTGAVAPVLCADHRPVMIYPQEVTDQLVGTFRPNNARYERIAIVVAPTNAVLLLQLERVAREAGSEKRRVFKEPTGALTHLTGALDVAEFARARAFLAELALP
jgi:hypothetical protein